MLGSSFNGPPGTPVIDIVPSAGNIALEGAGSVVGTGVGALALGCGGASVGLGLLNMCHRPNVIKNPTITQQRTTA